MLKTTLLCLLLALACSLVYGYFLSDDDFDDTEGLDEGYGQDLGYHMVKRERRPWCAKWGKMCAPKAKLRFAQCCSGLRCICGKFWTQSKCQCKSANILG